MVTGWRPRWGLWLLLFLTLVADPVVAPWYPFVKGFSARESIFFVADWLIVSPLEVFILVAFAAWAVDAIRTRSAGVPRSTLLLAAVVFAAWIGVGFVWGVTAGGDLNVALWEVRRLSYAIAVLLLTSRYIRTKAELVGLIWAAMLAIAVEAVWIAGYYVFEIRNHAADFRALGDHATSVHFNTAIVLLAAAWIYRSSPVMRFGLPWMLAPLAVSHLVNQRRAAIVGLMIATALLLAAGLRVNRRLMRRVVPIVGVVATLWLVVYWNDPGPIGLPARAVKSVLNSQQRSTSDRSSDYYRLLEDQDIIATIRDHPAAGVGFGRPFNLVVALPSIESFVWWRYITHNSVLWVWMKTGVGGFVALLFLWGVAIQTGARASVSVQDGDLGAIAATAALFVVMHAIYAFVDMAWDPRSAVYLGVMIGVVNSIDGLSSPENRGGI
jgi:hypothetical protein